MKCAAHTQAAAALASFEPIVCEVVDSETAEAAAPNRNSDDPRVLA